MLNTGVHPRVSSLVPAAQFTLSHNAGHVSSLLQTLQDTQPQKYFLSKTACLGILRRAKAREKQLPIQLKTALMIQAGIETEAQIPMTTTPLLCLADQGGERMDVTEDFTVTLRASMAGHQPIVMASTQPNAEIYQDLSPTLTSASGQGGGNTPFLFENNAMDCRYNGPLEVAPTITSSFGSGGNNTSLVATDTYCIASNIINRADHNGGNGLGVQTNLSYTLTTVDVPAVFGQASYGGYQNDVSTLCASGGNNGGGSENLAVTHNLVRRLTPLECERLMGFPDGWTNIEKANDSARYRALGNSIVVPCVEFLMRGIAHFIGGKE